MPVERIVQYLGVVLSGENIDYEEPALWLLGRAAQGSMRDALSLTEQAVSFCDGAVMSEGVSVMLGSIDHSRVLDIINAIVESNAAELLSQISELADHSPDYSAVLNELLSVFHQIAVAQMVPGAVDGSSGYTEQVVHLAEQTTAEDIQLFYQSGLVGRRDLPLSPDMRSGFEMILLRMLAFRPKSTCRPVEPLPDASLSSTGHHGMAKIASSLENERPKAVLERSEAALSERDSQDTVSVSESARNSADSSQAKSHVPIVTDQQVAGAGEVSGEEKKSIM